MRPIRRAAVTGLFALWLAPLPVLAGGQATEASPGYADDRCQVMERRIAAQEDARGGLSPRRAKDDA